MGLKHRGLGWLRFNSGDLDTTVITPPAAFRDSALPADDMKNCLIMAAEADKEKAETSQKKDMKNCLIMKKAEADTSHETNPKTSWKQQKEPWQQLTKRSDQTVLTKRSDLTHFANNCSLHGLPRVFPEESKGWDERRSLWGMTVLVMMLVFLYWAAVHLWAYFSFPISTKLHLQSAIELFPAVTICNLNTYRVSQLTSDDLYTWGHKLGFLYKNKTLKPHGLPYLDQREEAVLELAKFSPEGHVNVSMSDMLNRTGHDLKDMVKKCTYQGRACNDSMFTPVSTCLHL
ncbi:acid-sensing ion channel 1C-like [Branchiostoma floridae x Branchiostoma belcheri]